jgi:hypothetical protein
MGFLEVIRNLAGEIIYARRIKPEDMRLIRKDDDPYPVKKTIIRGGQDTEITFMERQRRFVQMSGKKKIYFKEFGTERVMNKHTGLWEDDARDGEPVKAEDLASEVIYFHNELDEETGYGLPRWMGAQASVEGQHQAEALNLEFFKSGGLPPVLITVEGGELTEDANRTLNLILQGAAKEKLAGAVLTANSTGGTLEREGSVKINVHKFGADAQKDSMFEGYMEKCHIRIRRQFRLPQMFIGDTEGLNFATAYTTYMLADTQVFQPERIQEDEVYNRTLLRDASLGGGEYEIKSKPLTLNNVETRVKAIDSARREGGIGMEQYLKLLNQETGLAMTDDAEKVAAEREAKLEQDANVALAKALSGGGNLNKNGTPTAAPSAKSEGDGTGLSLQLIAIANDIVDVLLDDKPGSTPAILQRFTSLKADDQTIVRTMVAQNVLRFQGHDEAAAEALLLVYPDLGLTINDQD